MTKICDNIMRNEVCHDAFERTVRRSSCSCRSAVDTCAVGALRALGRRLPFCAETVFSLKPHAAPGVRRHVTSSAIGIYGTIVPRRLHAMGIRDKPIALASPWQNGFAERLIGSIRRECLDHLVVLSEAHLRRILQAYARYYNKIRTHRSLDKDAPFSRPVQRIGNITSHALLGGLHREYVRV